MSAAEKNQNGGSVEFIKDTGEAVHTVVFVGNGAIVDGSAPLQSALDRWLVNDKSVPKTVTNLRRRTSEHMHLLALMSYKFKVARGLEYNKWRSNKSYSTATFPEVILTFLNLRKSIASAFAAADLQPRFTEEIQRLIGENAHYITTNWDNGLWTQQNVSNLVHLHGRCNHADSVVLPTELLVEDTAYDFIWSNEAQARALMPQFGSELQSVFRFKYQQVLLQGHDRAVSWLKSAKRVIIWGYSLSDYDADLSALIATHSPASAELMVINPDIRVFHRAIGLTGISNALHYDPATDTSVRLC